MSAKFCPKDGSIINEPNLLILEYICSKCGFKFPMDPLDTELYVDESYKKDLTYEFFKNNCSFDNSNYKIKKQCGNKDCGTPYLTQIRIGSKLIRTCHCGYKEEKE